MVEAARARGINADNAQAEQLPYPDAAFDAVFSNAALHWVRDQEAMLAEVRRVLRPGGRFVAEMGGHGNIAAIRVAFMAVLARYGHSEAEDGVNYYPAPDAYRRRLERNGFAIERMEHFPRPTPLGEGGMAGWIRTFRRGVLDSTLQMICGTRLWRKRAHCSIRRYATKTASGWPITSAFASSPARAEIGRRFAPVLGRGNSCEQNVRCGLAEFRRPLLPWNTEPCVQLVVEQTWPRLEGRNQAPSITSSTHGSVFHGRKSGQRIAGRKHRPISSREGDEAQADIIGHPLAIFVA